MPNNFSDFPKNLFQYFLVFQKKKNSVNANI